MIYFLHVPKTAGSTIRSILAQNFHPDTHFGIPDEQEIKALLELPEDKLNQLKIISGHFYYGLHRKINRPGSYFTMLRHPVDRFLSEYSYVKDRWQHDPTLRNLWKAKPAYAHFLRNNLSIEAFVEQSSSRMDNIFIRMISGNLPRARPVTEANLASAKALLQNNIDLFGITERFNESMLLIAKKYRFKCPVHVVKNVGVPREISSEVRAQITEKQKFDVALYHWAVDRFNQLVESQGALFRSALAEFEAAVEAVNKNYDREKNLNFWVTAPPDADALEAGKQCKIVEQYFRQDA